MASKLKPQSGQPHHSTSSPLPKLSKGPGAPSRRIQARGAASDDSSGDELARRLRSVGGGGGVGAASTRARASRATHPQAEGDACSSDAGDEASTSTSSDEANGGPGGGKGGGGAGGFYDVDAAIKRARRRASRRMLEAQSIRVRRAAGLPALLAKLGPGGDLDDDDDELTPAQMRELVQAERAREQVKEALLTRRLLDPQLVAPPGLPSGVAGSGTGGGGGGSGWRGSTTSVRGSLQELSTSCTSPGGTGTGYHTGTGTGGGTGTARHSQLQQLKCGGGNGNGGGGDANGGGGGFASAPASPMAAAAARRRQQMLDASSPKGGGLANMAASFSAAGCRHTATDTPGGGAGGV
ncbi:hypothetical protein CHLRE_01g003508v5 [Chlamydomonas reinhardtii]|uniref:Uncharacterized protein n=1 Tax=Chlamydomonas reinhardtii TaxID=3055 RepID=A0A2K3E4U9_CHLRE|nr:uncharacterized protein CHLRE_01g003508v5 [Chlamydomonas reinhardtii]PNW87825.1 hypothetical protein CHLRE_01g003508v5 [Chlamydomonas reinhardtii]